MRNVRKVGKKESKMIFFAIFLTFVARIDAIRYMTAGLTIVQHVAVVLGHAQLNRYA